MLTRSELPENPVVLALAGEDGRPLPVEVERVRGGLVRMRCGCGENAAQGWCRHQVELLCLRYDRVLGRDPELEFQLEDIVMGTPLADLADELDLAAAEHAQAWKALEACRGAAERHPGAVAERAADLADAARRLDVAVARFRKRLAAADAAQ
ncbi:MAG TPA: hypothetical protein VM434_11885 [Beijerinckiaceae bacterium]|nr:hypothetical protein [Beijerinckiaceae bacterium]